MPYSRASESDNRPRATTQQINATPIRCVLTLLAVKILKRFQKNTGSVIIISDKLCVKCGRRVGLSEASTIQFVAKHTSIPVPRVYCAFVHKDRTYIVMERIRGGPAGFGWLRRSQESKTKVLDQLKKMVEEICRIKPPEGVGVANIDGGPLYDPRVPGASLRFGPFKNIQEFHRYLRGGLEADAEHWPEINELISWHDTHDFSLVFTHADLSSLNVLVSGDQVVGGLCEAELV